MTMNEENSSSASLGCVFMVLLLVYGLVQVYAGYLGIEHHMGSGWAVGAVVVAFVFRFALPLTIGSFFAAMNVWDWHWFGALAFAAPGLVFMTLMIPGALAGILERQGGAANERDVHE